MLTSERLNAKGGKQKQKKKTPSLKLISVSVAELQFRNTQFSFRSGEKPQKYSHTHGRLNSIRPWLVQGKQKLCFWNPDKYRFSQKIPHRGPDAAGPLRIDFSGVFLQRGGCSCQDKGSSWHPRWRLQSSALRLAVWYLRWLSTLATPITRPF